MSLIALVENERKLPEFGLVGICQECGSKMIPVLGDVYKHHWRHLVKGDCISEGETQWHIDMKSMFPAENIEVKKNNHRADVLLDNDTAIEFQYSSIQLSDVVSRNNNYKKVIWVFNLEDQYGNGQIEFGYKKELDQYFDTDQATVLYYTRPKSVLTVCMPNLFVYIKGEFYYIVKIEEKVQFNEKTRYNEKYFILHYFAFGSDGFIDKCYEQNDEPIKNYEFSEPKYFMVDNKKVSYFDTRFLKIAGKKYELTGTEKVDYNYIIDVKNIETNETKKVPFDTVVSWFYL